MDGDSSSSTNSILHTHCVQYVLYTNYLGIYFILVFAVSIQDNQHTHHFVLTGNDTIRVPYRHVGISLPVKLREDKAKRWQLRYFFCVLHCGTIMCINNTL